MTKMTKKIYFIATKNDAIYRNYLFNLLILLFILESKNSKRKHWIIEEEKYLRQLISQHGTKNWDLISNLLNTNFPELPKNNSHQCKDRYLLVFLFISIIQAFI